MVSKKTVTFIAMSQTWFAFMILIIKYGIEGFKNITGIMLLKDLLFLVPSTVFIIAWTVLILSGVNGILDKFNEIRKEETKKQPKSKVKGNR